MPRSVSSTSPTPARAHPWLKRPKGRPTLGWLAGLQAELDAHRQALIGRRAPELDGAQRPAWQHVLVAIGGPREARQRAQRLGQTCARLVSYRDIHQRLSRAVDAERISGVPSRAQLLFGGFDMLRFLFEPGSRETDAQRGIELPLHRVLRLLGDPVSVLDPGGVTASLEQVLNHITEEFHFNPSYDLQLLATFPGGFEALEARCDAIMNGSHPRATQARARVTRADYHAALRDYAVAVRQDPACAAPRFRALNQSEQRSGPPPMAEAELASFLAAAQSLSSLWGFLDYCHALPTNPAELAGRALRVHTFPAQDQAHTAAHP